MLWSVWWEEVWKEEEQREWEWTLEREFRRDEAAESLRRACDGR